MRQSQTAVPDEELKECDTEMQQICGNYNND